jgi:hypothetical protein
MRHNPHTPCAEKWKVKEGVALFTEASKRYPFVDAKVTGDGKADPKEDELTDEGEKDDVIGNEGKVEPALTISRVRNVIRWWRGGIRDEEERSKGTNRGIGENERREDEPIYV